MQIDILNIEGKKQVELLSCRKIFSELNPTIMLIYLAVKQYLAAQRQGTHKVKTRAEVQGCKPQASPPERNRWKP